MSVQRDVDIQLPFEKPHPLQAAPLLRTLQAAGPVHRIRTAVGDEAWLVTGYEQVRSLLDDDRLGRSHPDPASAARTGESALFGGPVGDFTTEHTDHARMRALLQPHFSPKRMRALRPRVEALTARLLDELAEHGSPADLVEALALPLPIAVICELLGVPFEDRAQFRTWTRAAADVQDGARSQQGLADLFRYGQELVARKRREPGDDVISQLCATEGVSDGEAAAMGMFLLFAGHETTVVAIGMGAVLLLSNPAQWQALLADPDRIGSAVDEILRAQGTGGGGIPRYARTDLEIAGVTVRAGELVLLDTGSANHDGAVFPEPDRFDVSRRDAGHVTFGHGARYCIGAPLARIELQAVFSRLVPRFPEMRLAVGVDGLAVHTGTLTGGLREIPVTW
ncbi:cytochrome P450 [Pseudonocardia nigra]|uniref:cytochrome P450 n=1 Tax=Pseudonocardia nigra TaxID=1921578 RepID=UPI001C5F80B7|nr:cytochrome P450 [Pseudonocardia nigra]